MKAFGSSTDSSVEVCYCRHGCDETHIYMYHEGRNAGDREALMKGANLMDGSPEMEWRSNAFRKAFNRQASLLLYQLTSATVECSLILP